MTAIVPSLWSGAGGAILAGGVYFFELTDVLGKVPKIPHAALFATTISLVDRVIEFEVRQEFKDVPTTKFESVVMTALLVGIKILTPYVLKSSLEKAFQIKVPTSFLHLQSAIYVGALADGEFENLAAKCFHHLWTDHEDHRIIAVFARRVHLNFLGLFGADI